MKVLLVSHGYPPEKFGGTETYTRWLAIALSRRGHTVKVFTRSTGDGGDGEEYSVKRYYDGEVEILAVKNTFSIHNEYELHYRNPFVEVPFAAALDEFKPDVAHFTYLLGGLSAGFIDAAKSRKIKTIVTLTDFHHLCAWGQLFTKDGHPCDGPEAGIRCASCFAGEDPYAGLPRWRKPILMLFPPEKRAMKLHGEGVRRMNRRLNYLREKLNMADFVIFPTEALAGPYRKWGVDGRTLCFGLDKSLFENFQRAKSNKVRLTFIGQLGPHKGLHILGEALRGLTDIDNWSLDIYAAINTEEEKIYLANSIVGIVDRVSFNATFDPGEISRVYEATDALVVPSLWTENSPLVILYAVHTETTLVASDVAGIGEVARDWGLYYPPNEVNSLRDILRKLFSDSSMLNRDGAPRIPDIDEHAEVIEKIYQKVNS